MSIKKEIMKIFNGSDWDIYYPKTTAEQVIYENSDLGTEVTKLGKHVTDNSNVYTHSYDAAKTVLSAGAWQWLATNDLTFQANELPSGEYEATYACNVTGSGNGVLTMQALVNGEEPSYSKSRCSIPLGSNLYTVANATFRFTHVGTNTLGIALKSYGSVGYTPQSAVITLKRIGDKAVAK